MDSRPSLTKKKKHKQKNVGSINQVQHKIMETKTFIQNRIWKNIVPKHFGKESLKKTINLTKETRFRHKLDQSYGQ